SGEETAPVRCDPAGPSDLFAFENIGSLPGGKGVRQTCLAGASIAQAIGRIVCLDQRGGLAGGGIPCLPRKGCSRFRAKDPPAPLCAATAGFPGVPFRAGVFENRLAAAVLERFLKLQESA